MSNIVVTLIALYMSTTYKKENSIIGGRTMVTTLRRIEPVACTDACEATSRIMNNMLIKGEADVSL